jgi:hypothetical protein
VHRIRFRVHVGCCRRCGQRVQGRHPQQTSDALGSAASQLGPRALALATELNKGLGLPYGKTSAVLKQAFGLEVTPGGVCQAIARAGRKAGRYRCLKGVHCAIQIPPEFRYMRRRATRAGVDISQIDSQSARARRKTRMCLTAQKSPKIVTGRHTE